MRGLPLYLTCFASKRFTPNDAGLAPCLTERFEGRRDQRLQSENHLDQEEPDMGGSVKTGHYITGAPCGTPLQNGTVHRFSLACL